MSNRVVLAIDPGPVISGWVLRLPDKSIPQFGITENIELRRTFRQLGADVLVQEMIGFYGTGMPVPKEAFHTCLEIGKNMEAWKGATGLLLRKTIVAQICGNARAKDSNVRQALIDRYGGERCIKKGGALYKVSSHVWSALAVAVAYDERGDFEL